MNFHPFIFTVLGGLLIGFAAGVTMFAGGGAGSRRVADGVVRPRSTYAWWQALFLVGSIAGGMCLAWLDPASLPAGESTPLQLTTGARLLLGFGAMISKTARFESRFEFIPEAKEDTSAEAA